MQRWTRAALSGAAVVSLAAGLLAVGTAAGTPRSVPDPVPAASGNRPGATGDPIADLQRELDRVPGKYPAWSALGMAYVDRARVTADPTLYERAAGCHAHPDAAAG